MLVFLLLVLVLGASASDDCLTATQQPGKCVLINHCPHLFTTVLQNQTEKSRDGIRRSYCGFESMFFPKVCCPVDAVNYFEEGGAISQNQYSTKCGLHEPNGQSDPWLALIEYEKPNGQREFLCGGVLINKRYVLTAAHCVKGWSIGPNIKLVNVHFGEHTSNPIIVPVDGTTVHENYDPDDLNQNNDIALVRLKNKISFKQGLIKPICIPMGKKDFLGKTLSVTGYEKVGGFLKKRDGIATVWNNTECHLAYNVREVKLSDSQMCAGGRRLHYRHSHRFDFGGVLMHVSADNVYSAVGILSLQPSCCDKENYPKVYTRVANYTEWIISKLKP